MPGEFSYRPVGGGSINSTFQILTKPNKRWFGKFNNARQFPGLFIKESNGLALLRRLGPIRVPTVIGCMEAEDTQVLLLEWIDEGLRTGASPVTFTRSNTVGAYSVIWRRFGHQLALQHQVSPPQPAFGLGENNYMGALVQDNTPSTTWVEFFRDRRLEP